MTIPTSTLPIVTAHRQEFFIPFNNIPEILIELEACRLYFNTRGNLHVSSHPDLSHVLLDELSPKFRHLIDCCENFSINSPTLALQDIAVIEKLIDNNKTLFETQRGFFSRHSRFFHGFGFAMCVGLGGAAGGAPALLIVVAMLIGFALGYGIFAPLPTHTSRGAGRAKHLLKNLKDLIEPLQANALPATTPLLVNSK